jgi:hypothetical protein
MCVGTQTIPMKDKRIVRTLITVVYRIYSCKNNHPHYLCAFYNTAIVTLTQLKRM